MNINLFQLIKDSWQATWRHKNMWWLGMFVFGGGSLSWQFYNSGMNFALDSDTTSSGTVGALASPLWRLWLEDYWWVLMLLVFFFFIGAVVAMVLHLIAQSGLYYGANQARLGHPVQLGEMIKAGFSTFFRYLGFYVLLAVAKLVALCLIVINFIGLVWSVIGLLFVLPLFMILLLLSVPLAIAINIFVIYCLQGMTLHHHTIKQTMLPAWQRLRRYPGENALAFIAGIFIELIAGFVLLLVGALVAAPFAILAYVTYTSDAVLGLALSIISGVSLLLIILLVWKAIVRSMMSHYWHRVYAAS